MSSARARRTGGARAPAPKQHSEQASALAPAQRLQQAAGNRATAAAFDGGASLQSSAAAEAHAERVAKERLARQPGGSPAPVLPAVDRLGDSHAPGRTGTEPLPRTVRADLEPRLGFDLGAVRVRRDAPAAELAERMGARAFTVGRTIVFGRGEFDPAAPTGRRLIAHELVHVLQQAQSGRPVVQRTPVEAWIDVPRFDWTGKQQEQRQTTEYVPTGSVLASYDAEAGVLRCTFQMHWSVERELQGDAHGLELMQQKFEQVVRATWEHRYTLVERDKGAPTGRTAQVELAFKPVGVDVPSAHRYEVDVTGYPRRANVRGGSDVFISTWDFDRGRAADHFKASDYPERARPAAAPKRSWTQQTAAHEFGHMIGLADEYPLTTQDLADLRAVDPDKAEEQLRRRNASFSNRIMNVGSEVTPDSYAPFALWLSRITHREWVVGPAQRPVTAPPHQKEQATP